MSLKGVAAATLRIRDAGQYQSNTETPVVFRTKLQTASAARASTSNGVEMWRVTVRLS